MRFRGVLCGLGLLLIAGCGSAHTAAGRVVQPSDGWHPGQPGMAAALIGPIVIADGCANGGQPTLWPDGWTVNGSDLLDQTGRVVAHDGQHVTLPGGLMYAPATTSCGITAGQQVWAVEGPIT